MRIARSLPTCPFNLLGDPVDVARLLYTIAPQLCAHDMKILTELLPIGQAFLPVGATSLFQSNTTNASSAWATASARPNQLRRRLVVVAPIHRTSGTTR